MVNITVVNYHFRVKDGKSTYAILQGKTILDSTHGIYEVIDTNKNLSLLKSINDFENGDLVFIQNSGLLFNPVFRVETFSGKHFCSIDAGELYSPIFELQEKVEHLTEKCVNLQEKMDSLERASMEPGGAGYNILMKHFYTGTET